MVPVRDGRGGARLAAASGDRGPDQQGVDTAVSASIRAASGPSAWRVAVIGLVAVLSAGIGIAVGAFLLDTRAGALGGSAAYVPADAPFYLELRVEPSAAQDAALRELLGSFPAVEGLDLARPLHEQLVELIDEELSAVGEVDLRWADDVAPWFDGRVALGVTDLPLDALAAPMDPMAEPPMPGMIVIAGVTDPAAARSTIERIRTEHADLETTDSEHRGVTIHALSTGDGAYAVTDDALLVAPSADDIAAALDTAADPQRRLSADTSVAGMAAQLPGDWLAFATYDFTELTAASFAAAEGTAASEAFATLMEHQPMRGALAVTAAGDRLAFDGVSEAPAGPFAMENAERGLAAEAPGDALYFSDGGNIGVALSALVDALKVSAQEDPSVAEQIDTAEAVLGADLEEMVAWIDDGALVAGWDGSEPYAGLVLVPNDVTAAQRRIGQLVTFAGLAALDPSSGITVDEAVVAGETVTTFRWQDPNAIPMEELPIPTGIAVQVAVTDDRAIIGVGESFVGRVLELEDGDSLAVQPRYRDGVAALGPVSNAGVAWLDLAGLRKAVETALGPMLDMVDPDGAYESTVAPWLAPLDRLVTVTVLDGELLVQRSALLIGE